jgi:polysaccharide pyruvyl transferase WcaK-like protein
VNANYLHAEKDAGIPPALKVFIQQLLRQPLSLVLIPHDTRSKRPDQRLLEEATAGLSAAERERIFMLPPVSPGVVRAVTPALDMLATGRMHTAILGLSGGTAPFNFAYQDKFEGLLQFFKLDQSGLLCTPKELTSDPVRVAEKFLHVLHDKETFQQHIQQYLPQVLTLARANFL